MYTQVIKQQIATYNLTHSEKLNTKKLAEKIGVPSQVISQLGKRFTIEFQAHMNFIFNDKDRIKENFKLLLDRGIVMIVRLDLICKALECEIWDIIKYNQKK
jgi:DNA-binding Xre family transcriptional regulator